MMFKRHIGEESTFFGSGRCPVGLVQDCMQSGGRGKSFKFKKKKITFLKMVSQGSKGKGI